MSASESETPGIGHNSSGAIAADRLKSFVARIEALETEKRSLAEDIKEIYAEAKGAGFDVKALRKVVAIRRMDADDYDEQMALIDTYMRVFA